MTHYIRIVGLADGTPTAFDGLYLQEYDPARDGIDPDGRSMLAHIVCTPDKDAALGFADLAEAHATWTKVDPRAPIRPWDGQPHRPLTAFTVSYES